MSFPCLFTLSSIDKTCKWPPFLWPKLLGGLSGHPRKLEPKHTVIALLFEHFSKQRNSEPLSWDLMPFVGWIKLSYPPRMLDMIFPNLHKSLDFLSSKIIQVPGITRRKKLRNHMEWTISLLGRCLFFSYSRERLHFFLVSSRAQQTSLQSACKTSERKIDRIAGDKKENKQRPKTKTKKRPAPCTSLAKAGNSEGWLQKVVLVPQAIFVIRSRKGKLHSCISARTCLKASNG